MTSTKYPIEICCVVANNSDVDTDIEIVNEYTSNLGLKFNLREYDTWKYSDDRDMVSSLPAFHVYFGNGYIDTFYPDEKLLDNIDDCIKQYEKIQGEKRKFIGVWVNFLKFWKSKSS